MLDAWDNPSPLPEAVESFFDGYGHDSISHWFTGNLTTWRTLYFGDTKYKPDDVWPEPIGVGGEATSGGRPASGAAPGAGSG